MFEGFVPQQRGKLFSPGLMNICNFESIKINKIHKKARKPQKIQTDKGVEFSGKQVQDYFKKEGLL